MFIFLHFFIFTYYYVYLFLHIHIANISFYSLCCIHSARFNPDFHLRTGFAKSPTMRKIEANQCWFHTLSKTRSERIADAIQNPAVWYEFWWKNTSAITYGQWRARYRAARSSGRIWVLQRPDWPCVPFGKAHPNPYPPERELWRVEGCRGPNNCFLEVGLPFCVIIPCPHGGVIACKNLCNGSWGPEESISCTLRNPSFWRALWSGQFWALRLERPFNMVAMRGSHSEVPFGVR